MGPFRLRTAAACAVLVAGASAQAPAAEPTCDAFISTLPYTINAPGHYCLAGNLTYSATSGAAITINANSVVLDLKGFKLGGQAAGSFTGTSGVFVTDRSTVVVRNGLLRGFFAGVYIDGILDNNNNIVEDVTADSNTTYGIYVGLGRNNTVRRCVVGSTGGTPFETATAGISVGSDDSFVTSNTVTGTTPSQGGSDPYSGITVQGLNGRVVSNQVIGDAGTGSCFSFTGTDILYKGNVASQCGTAYAGSGTAIGVNFP